MTTVLESRYRRLPRILPADYRAEWEAMRRLPAPDPPAPAALAPEG